MATKGTNVVITYAAANGYKIVAVSINGIKQSGASIYGYDSMRGTYTIKNVTANTTLNVVCQTINSNTLPLPPVGAGLSLANLEANMITVPGGSFTMGATSEQLTNNGDGFSSPWWSPTTQQVTLSSYKICRFEVTQQLWLDVMGTNPSYFTGDFQRPVEQVSWNDCQAFITKLNQLTGKSYRLPTEAEWEYAARGGASTITSYIYSGSNTLNNVAWVWSYGGYRTHTVGTLQANALGIFDMSGNVLEWCYDWYGNYSNTAVTNPLGANYGSYRVIRGGSWDYIGDYCRVSYRSYTPSSSGYNFGLRLSL